VRGARLPASIKATAFAGIDRGSQTVRWLAESGALIEQRLTDGWLRESDPDPARSLASRDVVVPCGMSSLVALRDGAIERWRLPAVWSAWRSAATSRRRSGAVATA
jgi:hypothetical protein